MPYIHRSLPLFSKRYIDFVRSFHRSTLIAYYPLGADYNDYSGNARHASGSGDLSQTSGIGDGRKGTNFGGTNGVVTLPASFGTAFNAEEGTIMIHVRLSPSVIETNSTVKKLINIVVTTNNRLLLNRNTTAKKLQAYYIAGGTSKSFTWNHITSEYTCYFIVWSKSADYLKVYANNTLMGTATGLGSWSGTPAELTLGYDGSTYFVGDLAHFACWSETLTTTHMAELLRQRYYCMDAALGGSITKGSNASDEAHKYRNLVHAWLQSTYVNGFPRVAWSAIGGSHSFQNLFRLDALIAQHPRLIIIDSAVNDDNSTASRGCAEIVIRRLRTYLPNTKLLGLLNIRVADPDIDDPTNVNQTQHDDWVDLLTYYSIPYADFAAEVQAKVPGTHPLNWYLADTVHPTDNGHATIATLIEAQLSSFLPPTGALPDYLRYYSVDFNYPPQIVYVKDCFRYGTWTLDANGAYCSSQAGATITIPTPITCRAISASDGVEGDLSGLPSVLVSQDGGITFVTMTLDENGHYCFLWPRQPRNIVLKVVSGTYKIKYFMFI